MNNILESYLTNIPVDKKMLVINSDETDTMVICVSDVHNINFEPIKEDMKIKLIGEINKKGQKKSLSTISLTVNPKMIANAYETYFRKNVDNFHKENIDFCGEYSSSYYSLYYKDKKQDLEILLRIEDEIGNKFS